MEWRKEASFYALEKDRGKSPSAEEEKGKKKGKKEEKTPNEPPCISLTPNAQGRWLCQIKNISDIKSNCTTRLPKNTL